jgi:amidase
MTPLCERHAVQLAKLVRDREVGCLELLDYFIERVERLDSSTNAVVVRDFERARDRARKADSAPAADAARPLHGVPMTIKESFALEGTPTTYGVAAFRDNIATRNALAVDRLLAAGANVFGKTNVPPWLMDAQSANEIYGRTNNPWNLERSPGGSSGGSAAAIAAGLTGLEIGSDIASSIRNPAHYCGVFGHKPTYGICPTTGHSLSNEDPPAADISVIGPIARSVADLELTLALIAGPDPSVEPWTLSLPPCRLDRLGDFRVAILLDDPFAIVDRQVQEPIRQLGEFLGAQGAKVSFEARPQFDSRAFYELYMLLMRSATTDRLSDEDVAKAGQQLRQAPSDALAMASLSARGVVLSHREWLRLNAERHRIRRQWNAWFKDHDVLLCPPFSTAAIPHTTVPTAERTLMVNGSPRNFGNQLLWAGLAGALHLPATVAPLALTADGLPTGVQIIGRQYGDLTCLRFASLLEREYRAFVPPPGYADSPVTAAAGIPGRSSPL